MAESLAEYVGPDPFLGSYDVSLYPPNLLGCAGVFFAHDRVQAKPADKRDQHKWPRHEETETGNPVAW